MKNFRGSRLQALMLEEFLAADPELRYLELQNLEESQAKALIDTWIASEEFKLTEALMLPDPFKIWTTRKAKARGLTFYVGLNPDWEPSAELVEQSKPEWIKQLKESFEMQLPNEHNIRLFRRISGIESLPADKALQCLMQAGPSGSFPHQRGRLKEFTKAEFFAQEADKATSAPDDSKRNKKARASA